MKGGCAMKVVYPVCCGVDVHKTFLVATIITSQGITPHYSKKRFSTFNNSILQFKQWLIVNNCYDVCMESTGKYWVPIHNLLEDTIRVTIANPKWVKAVKGNKDDTKDSKWIGDLFRLGLVPGSYIPGKPIRILREYTRYRSKLVSCKSSEKNAAVKSNRSPYYKIKYERISKRRGKKRAIIAIARMILTTVFNLNKPIKTWDSLAK
jgi:transposase